MITEHEFIEKKDEILASIEYLAACTRGIEKDVQIDAMSEIRDAANQAMLSLEKEGEDDDI